MRQFFNVILFLVFTSLIFIACDDTKITDPPIPTEDVSYAQHIQPIFNNHCSNSGCHNSQDNAGGIDLTSWGSLKASPFLVIPFYPDESLLYLSVSGGSVNIMPPPNGSSPPLSENQINGIRTWILEGAESN